MTQTPDEPRRRSLDAAKATKNDEFYTQWAYIEHEMNAYLEYDPDLFRDKVLLLPCDDPEWSNFTKFFALHFMDFGLRRLISRRTRRTLTRPVRSISRRYSRPRAPRSMHPRTASGEEVRPGGRGR